ncbi:MAG TPA: carboxypeptidase regulatory-like domain-containing protein, partial [Burkholderiales bacterium]
MQAGARLTIRAFFRLTQAAAGTLLLLFLQAGFEPARAQAAAPSSFGGRVRSVDEGPMEGVLVGARKAGSTITTTVVSDSDGSFDFPQSLAPGRYALRIRAIGYELDGPSTVDVAAPTKTQVNIRLRKTQDLAAQLSNTEWLMSMPGDIEQKRPLIECMSCHTFERVARSRYDADGMLAVLKRMAGYANNSTMARVQKRTIERKYDEESLRKLAAYLASVNLSKSPTWSYELKTLPRPKGRATRAIVTEYDLPRKTIAPHDVRTDAEGRVWYSNFVENFLGRLDPRTGAHAEFAYPIIKPGAPTGALALEPDKEGNWWLATMFQTGLVEFDVKSETFRVFRLPPGMNTDASQQSMVMPRQSQVDGKVWTNEVSKQSILRLDLASGRYELIDPFKYLPAGSGHSPYGLAADSANNLFFMDFAGEAIGRVDAKTGQSTLYPTPTRRSRPRRTVIDSRGRVWFAEFAANKVAMFDTRSETFREWEVPTPHTYPYDVFVDRNGELWSGSMSSDRVLRFDPESGKSVEYLLPRQTNIRRVFVDDSTRPVSF